MIGMATSVSRRSIVVPQFSATSIASFPLAACSTVKPLLASAHRTAAWTGLKAAGRYSLNVVPVPTSLDTVMCPWCRWTMP